MSFYRQQLEEWLKTIDVNAERVLDIGGASNPVQNRVNSYKTNETLYLDNGKEEAKVAYLHFNINSPLEGQLQGYLLKDVISDTLFCLEVFEYVWNPVQAIKNIWDLMTNDSIAYISFPAIYPVHNPIEIDYLRYTRNVILKYLTLQGFTDIEIIPRIATKGREALNAFYSLEGMHPVRGSAEPYNIGYLVKARKLKIGGDTNESK